MKQFSKRHLIVLLGFALVIIFFIFGVWFEAPYKTLTKPYFNFLQKISYYEHFYQPDCHGRGCLITNLPHEAPHLIVFLIVAGSFLVFYYYLSDDRKTLKSYFKSMFDNVPAKQEIIESQISKVDVNNQKQKSLFHGVVAAFYFLIVIFLVLPIIIVLFTMFG